MSDKPVVNVLDNDIHCGANFQAASVASATEKIRPALHNDIPPNLAADDPGLSFSLKGINVNTAAYTSELGFLANPVINHVQSAEMHNQAVNSPGLLSARQTMAAVEVLSLIVANCLYTGCQGLDLRTVHRTFIASLRDPASQLIASFLPSEGWLAAVEHEFFDSFWKLFAEAWYVADERAHKASQ
ncbi:hypothetical protein N7522_004389 [Penicillium canescens]|nr:hypothetical protein N7522_004389 [Penicillium canescens]